MVNAFVSKTNRTLVPVRIEWSRYKLKSDEQYSVEMINSVVGNSYMCEPSDLGAVIQAKVKVYCFDIIVHRPDDKRRSIGHNRTDKDRPDVESANRWSVVQWELTFTSGLDLRRIKIQPELKIKQKHHVVF